MFIEKAKLLLRVTISDANLRIKSDMHEVSSCFFILKAKIIDICFTKIQGLLM